MKRTVFCFLTLLCLVLSCSHEFMLAQPRSSDEKAEIIKNLQEYVSIEYDEFRDITFVYPNVIDTYYMFYPYIGFNGKEPNGEKWMFLWAKARMNDWIFLSHVIVIVGENRFVTKQFTGYDSNVTRKVLSGGDVYEALHIPWELDSSQKLGRAIAAASSDEIIKYRLVGENGYKESILSIDEHEAWKNMILYFDNL